MTQFCVEAQQNVFDNIVIFYNAKREHLKDGMLAHIKFERQQ